MNAGGYSVGFGHRDDPEGYVIPRLDSLESREKRLSVTSDEYQMDGGVTGIVPSPAPRRERARVRVIQNFGSGDFGLLPKDRVRCAFSGPFPF
jgi:hypothetical protein